MSDRANTITVVLDRDMRTDDIEDLIRSIKMLKGVLTAAPNIADYSEYMAIERARTGLAQKLWEVLKP